MIKRCFSYIVVSCFFFTGFAQQPIMIEDVMTQTFNSLNHGQLFWLSSNKSIKEADEWLTLIDSADYFTQTKQKRATENIRNALSRKFMMDSTDKMNTDKQITTLVLHFIKDQQQGNVYFDYDEISISRDSVYINQLLKESVSTIVSRFNCKDPGYVLLKHFLHDSITVKDTLKYKAILLAMNYRLYFNCNHLSEYIVVNIPDAEAEYYKNDNLQIAMRTVVGRKLNPTPVIASYITSIITFPYWNVPYSIATKEILPKVQKDEKYLEQNNFDVVDAQGYYIDEADIVWAKYTEMNFPYFFRQSTGKDNALGILKFNLKNPFSIFLHATSNQTVFTRANRFVSHGCVRLEKPFDLADALLEGKLDIDALKKEKKDTESSTILLPHKIPTYIIYMPVKIVDNKLTFLPDVYGLLK